MTIFVAVPTRGVIFAETVRSIVFQKSVWGDDLIFESDSIINGMGIPDAFNEAADRARGNGATHILFVEEDNVIPKRGLESLVELCNGGLMVATVEYKLEGGTSVMRREGEVLWCGFGCTLIDMRALEGYKFSTDKTVSFDSGKMEWIDKPNKYGGHDVLFGLYLRTKQWRIGVVENMQADHLRLSSFERKTVNNGTHSIYKL